MSVFFSGPMGKESERGTNKLCEPRSGSKDICLFCVPIHSPFTQNKTFIPYIPTEKRNGEILKLLQIYKNGQQSKFMLTCMKFKIFLRQVHKMVRK